jgi:hypothetical protein
MGSETSKFAGQQGGGFVIRVKCRYFKKTVIKIQRRTKGRKKRE